MEKIEYLKVSLPEDIMKLKYFGDFDGVLRLIDKRLKSDIPTSLKKRLKIEKDIIEVLKKQYPYTYEEALGIMKENIKDFTEEELIKLKDESAADWIFVNGKVYFQERFFQTLTATRKDISDRLLNNRKNKEEKDLAIKKENLLNDTIREIKEKGQKTYNVHLKAGIKLRQHAIEEGKTVKVHLPIPAEAKQIRNIRILNTEPKAKYISEATYPQRTVYFEEIASEVSEFYVEYSYENHVEYIDLNPEVVSTVQPDFETNELEPHIMFTPYIKELCEEIVEGETNPLLKARKIYDFITTKVNYTFMREYFTVENISEYAALNLKGDCGVQALLFITLCRCAKIPAKWQSGLYVNPLFTGCHDWAQFYIEPYGWLFADCSFGGGALRRGCEERWNYYFGNIDPYRMVANFQFQHDFIPNKKFLRIDPYDNQRGEAEYEDRALTSDDFEIITINLNV